MGKREIYLSGVRARVATCQTQLEAVAARSGDGGKTASREQLDAWKAEAAAVPEKVAKLEALDRKWYGIKAEMEKTLRAIEAGLGTATPAVVLPDAEGPAAAQAKPSVTT